MSVDQLELVVALLSARERPQNPTVEEYREGFERLSARVGVGANTTIKEVDANGVPGELVTADRSSDEAVTLYLHGGGYVIGSPLTHRELARRLSVETGGSILVIDYRLAPEYPFPAAVEDSVSAYSWLLDRGLEPSSLSIAGDSAGGGLAVATLVSLKDQGIPLPSCGVALSPWVDMEVIGESMSTRADVDPMIQRDGLITMAQTYLNGADPRSPLAAPIYADLTGLPPLLIQVGTRETLYDDAIRLACRAVEAGLRVSFEPWKEMIHVWHLFAPLLDEGQQAIERIGEFIKDSSR